MNQKSVLLVHLMPDKLEVWYFCSVLDESPHILAVGFVDVIVHRLQIQAVHVWGNLLTSAHVN